jgi:hypothetical protein
MRIVGTRFVRFLFVILIIAADPAIADDGAASLAAGGIVFTNRIAVRMGNEDLYISPELVRVRFEFANDTPNDIETIVAFPLPDIDLADEYASMVGPNLPQNGPVNFMNFKATVDGRPIVFRTERRALIAERDVTSLVAPNGSQADVLTVGLGVLSNTLPPGELARLNHAGLLVGNTGNFGPKWHVRTRFFWSQRFPAHQRVVIEHSYKPVTGTWNSADAVVADSKLDARFCIGSGVKALVFKDSDALETDYILKTAKTWNGPIGHFHLTLDKLKALNSLSLCWDGELHRTSLTTFEFTQDNFVPTRDIQMLVLQ